MEGHRNTSTETLCSLLQFPQNAIASVLALGAASAAVMAADPADVVVISDSRTEHNSFDRRPLTLLTWRASRPHSCA